MNFDTLYVDCDILLYKVSFATQKNIYHIYVDGVIAWIGSDKRKINEIFKGIEYDYEKYTYIQPLMTAIHTYDTIIKGLKSKFNAKKVVEVLTGSTNFRDNIAVSREYKGTRHQDKPHNYEELKKYVVDRGAVVTVDEEADDYISYMTCNDYSVLAVTIDKDAYNTPSYIYNPDRETLTYVSEEDANKNFFTQVLTGDSVDNIPGLPSYGKVKAEAVLEEFTTYKELLNAVAWEYACHPKIDDPESYLIEQAILLWMRREPEEVWRIDRN